MAKAKKSTLSASSSYKGTTRKKRKGIHAKTKMSKNKNSKSYTKLSVGQGT